MGMGSFMSSNDSAHGSSTSSLVQQRASFQETRLNTLEYEGKFDGFLHDDDDTPETLAVPVVQFPPCFNDSVYSQQVQEVDPTPPKWDRLNNDLVLKSLKAVNAEALCSLGIREFYKSDSSWAKMNADQQIKSVSWF